MIRRWAPPAAWAALVCAFSLVPLSGVNVPQVPGGDKLVHLTLYFVLALFVNYAVKRPCLVYALSVTAGCGALGGAMELLQSYIPGRASDVWDALANLAGAAVAGAVYIRWKSRKAE